MLRCWRILGKDHGVLDVRFVSHTPFQGYNVFLLPPRNTPALHRLKTCTSPTPLIFPSTAFSFIPNSVQISSKQCMPSRNLTSGNPPSGPSLTRLSNLVKSSILRSAMAPGEKRLVVEAREGLWCRWFGIIDCGWVWPLRVLVSESLCAWLEEVAVVGVGIPDCREVGGAGGRLREVATAYLCTR